jgi:hypothetical protein
MVAIGKKTDYGKPRKWHAARAAEYGTGQKCHKDILTGKRTHFLQQQTIYSIHGLRLQRYANVTKTKVRTLTHAHTHMHARVDTDARTHTDARVDMDARTHTDAHVDMDARTHTEARTHAQQEWKPVGEV